MSEKARNTLVGLTTLLGLAGLGWLIVIFGDTPAWLKHDYPVLIALDNAAGISPGSRVKLNGVDVGEVTAIHLDPSLPLPVELLCSIEDKFSIPSDAVVTATASLLGGGGSLHLVVQASDQPAAPLPKTGEPGRLTGKASSLTQNLDSAAQLIQQELVAQLKKVGDLSGKLTELVEEYTAVGRDMRKLVEQRTPEEVDAGKAPGNLSTVLARTDERIAELKTTIDSMNALLGDEKMIADIRQTLANTRTLTEDAGTHLKTLTDRYIAVADDLSGTLTELNHLMVDLRRGKGTAGKLLQDPALYHSLEDAGNRMKDLIQEATLLLQKWKAEGLPVRLNP